MQNVSNIYLYFQDELTSIIEDREISSLCYIVIKYLLGYNRSDCILYSERILSSQEVSDIKDIVNQLKCNHPIQYILKEAFFMDLKLNITRNVLIPRKETEELVSWILEYNFNSVLDIGTGSGCIAIALAKYTQVSVCAVDISLKALENAKLNADQHRLNIEFIHKDIFKLELKNKFDLIVSNPPYVTYSEKNLMSANILDHEPHNALFVPDNDPICFYSRIADIASISLHSGGMLFLEINEKYGQDIVALLLDNGFVDIELKKDTNDRNRMIKATWK